MKTEPIEINGKQYIAKEVSLCRGCVAENNKELCNSLPDCSPEIIFLEVPDGVL